MTTLLGEVMRVVWIARRVERWRLTQGPRPALAAARPRGSRARRRDTASRLRLKRVIAGVERRLFREPNCYRRVLFEVSLDPDAAATPVCLGLPAAAAHAPMGESAPQTRHDVSAEQEAGGEHQPSSQPGATSGPSGAFGHAWLADDPQGPGTYELRYPVVLWV